mgnify:CR=1 FL=1
MAGRRRLQDAVCPDCPDCPTPPVRQLDATTRTNGPQSDVRRWITTTAPNSAPNFDSVAAIERVAASRLAFDDLRKSPKRAPVASMAAVDGEFDLWEHQEKD